MVGKPPGLKYLCFFVLLLLSSLTTNISAQSETLNVSYDDSFGDLLFVKNCDGCEDYLLIGNSSTCGYSKIIDEEPTEPHYWNIPENYSYTRVHNNHLYFQNPENSYAFYVANYTSNLELDDSALIFEDSNRSNIDLYEDAAYITNRSGIVRIFNISNPFASSLIGTVDLDNGQILFIENDLAFVVHHSNFTVSIRNVSNPLDLSIRQRQVILEPHKPGTCYIYGGLRYNEFLFLLLTNFGILGGGLVSYNGLFIVLLNNTQTDITQGIDTISIGYNHPTIAKINDHNLYLGDSNQGINILDLQATNMTATYKRYEIPHYVGGYFAFHSGKMFLPCGYYGLAITDFKYLTLDASLPVFLAFPILVIMSIHWIVQRKKTRNAI